MFTWINKDDEIRTVSLESDMTLLPWFVGTESVAASMLLWFKPAGQFVRTDLNNWDWMPGARGVISAKNRQF